MSATQDKFEKKKKKANSSTTPTLKLKSKTPCSTHTDNTNNRPFISEISNMTQPAKWTHASGKKISSIKSTSSIKSLTRN